MPLASCVPLQPPNTAWCVLINHTAPAVGAGVVCLLVAKRVQFWYPVEPSGQAGQAATRSEQALRRYGRVTGCVEASRPTRRCPYPL